MLRTGIICVPLFVVKNITGFAVDVSDVGIEPNGTVTFTPSIIGGKPRNIRSDQIRL